MRGLISAQIMEAYTHPPSIAEKGPGIQLVSGSLHQISSGPRPGLVASWDIKKSHPIKVVPRCVTVTGKNMEGPLLLGNQGARDGPPDFR